VTISRYQDVPAHTTLGARISGSFRTDPKKSFLFGIELGYRGGVPLVQDIGYGVPHWEGTPFFLLSFGAQTVER
jgi:hypothetical protein